MFETMLSYASHVGFSAKELSQTASICGISRKASAIGCSSVLLILLIQG